VVAFTSLSLATFAQASPVQTTVAADGPNHFQVSLETVVEASSAAVWSTLTDYEHHAQFMPYMTQSQLIESSPVVVQQQGRIRILFWVYMINVSQEVFAHPPSEIKFRAIAGDFKQLEGVWSLSDNHGKTNLACKFALQPKRKVPEWAVRLAVRHYLKEMLTELGSAE